MTAEACGPSFSQDTEQNRCEIETRSNSREVIARVFITVRPRGQTSHEGIMHDASARSKLFVSVNKNPVDVTKPNYYARDYYAEALPLGLESLILIIANRVWSDCLWKDGRRRQEGFLGSYFCVVDVDSGYPLAQAIKDVCDVQHIIGTTKSHGVKGDRYRIIFPWGDKITDLDLYRYNLGCAIDHFDGDGQCIDAARYFWPCREIVSASLEGPTKEVKPLPDNYKSTAEKQLLFAQQNVIQGRRGVLPFEYQHALRAGAPFQGRNQMLYRMAIALYHLGYRGTDLYSLVTTSNFLKNGDPMPDKEIRATLESAFKRYLREVEIVTKLEDSNG
jgi:hypothetical protein